MQLKIPFVDDLGRRTTDCGQTAARTLFWLMTGRHVSISGMDALMNVRQDDKGTHMAQIARLLHEHHLPFIWFYKEEKDNLSTLRTIGDPELAKVFMQFLDVMSQLHAKMERLSDGKQKTSSDIKQEVSSVPSDVKQEVSSVPSDVKQEVSSVPSDVKQEVSFDVTKDESSPLGTSAQSQSIIEAAQYCVRHRLALRHELNPDLLKQHLAEGGVAIVTVAASIIVSHFEKTGDAYAWGVDHTMFLCGFDDKTNEVLTNENPPVNRIPWDVFLKSWLIGEQEVLLVSPKDVYPHKC